MKKADLIKALDSYSDDAEVLISSMSDPFPLGEGHINAVSCYMDADGKLIHCEAVHIGIS